MNIDEALKVLNPELIERFKTAIELGKWPDGRPVSDEQRETCLQAVIAYEYKHLPANQRTGYVPPKDSSSDEQELTLK